MISNKISNKLCLLSENTYGVVTDLVNITVKLLSIRRVVVKRIPSPDMQ